MGSSHFGEPSLGNGGSGSSRKGKKSNSEKPKQPQRGLGVAQLEKIRLHSQMGCNYVPLLQTPFQTNLNQDEDVRVETTFSSSSPSSYYSSSALSSGFYPNSMMGLREMETMDFRYGDSQTSDTTRYFYGDSQTSDTSRNFYGDSQTSDTTRWNHNNKIFQPQPTASENVTRHLLPLPFEDSKQKKRRHDRCDSIGSISQNSDSSDTQELDLDLKLSL